MDNSFNFDEPVERGGSKCFKWDLAPRIFGSEDILPMWVADMDFKSPPEVVRSIRDRAAHAVYGYGARPDSYDEAFIAWAKKRYGFEIKKEEILFSPGIVPALSLCVMAFTSPGDGVIIQPPVYPPFAGVVRDWGRAVVENELKLSQDGARYEIDLDDLETKARHGARMMLLCSPHNPVGRCWTAEELERVLSICVKHNILVVSDEIHADIVYSGSKHIPSATVSEKAAGNMITLMSPSKTFNITGLSISSAVASNKDLREKLGSYIEKLHIGLTNVFGIEAFEAAYRYGEPWLTALLSYLEANRDRAVDFIRREIPPLETVKPESTFLLWIDFRKLGMGRERLKEFVVKEARLGLNDGASFGEAGTGFMRLNFACPRATLEEGLARLKSAVSRLMVFIIALAASLVCMNGTAAAGFEDFSEFLKASGAGEYVAEYPTCFFPPAHAPAESIEDGAKSLAAVIMPVIYFVTEKYPMYPEETSVKAGNENFSKYIPKVANLSGSIRMKVITDHLCSPLSLCHLDLLPNLTFAWWQNFYLGSTIKQDAFPIAVTLIDAGLNLENELVYYCVETGDYSIYLMYSPLAAPCGYSDLVARTLVYDKNAMRFSVRSVDAKTGAVVSDSPVAVLIHELKDMLSKFDRFEKIRQASATAGFSKSFEFLRLQIEKKIIKDEKKLASYRHFHFLAPSRREKLAALIKSVKTDILEPKLATYSARFAESKPLMAEMGEKNKNEQQRAILKKFSLLNEKIQKMNIKLVPRREYDLVFKKFNIGGH